MSLEAKNENDKPPARFSWLKQKQSDKLDSASLTTAEKPTSSDLRVSTPIETPKSVSLVGLFRYFSSPLSHSCSCLTASLLSFSTRFELFLNAIGIVAAIGAGAAQVCLEFPFPDSS